MGTQQFASGLSPIDTEIITSTRDNTQTIISRGEWVEKYKNQVQRTQTVVSANSTVTLLSITGSGYFDAAYSQLVSGTIAMYNNFEIWIDGVKNFTGTWQSNSAVTGMSVKENLLVDSASYLALPSPSTSLSLQAGSNISVLAGVVGPNNNYNSDGPVIRLSQPVFFNTSLILKVNNNQATSDTVNWFFSGGVK